VLRRRYLTVFKKLLTSAGAVGVFLALGAGLPGGGADAAPTPDGQRSVDPAPVAERLAAIRGAVSEAAAPALGKSDALAWWAWRNGGGGWRNAGGASRNGGGGWRNGGAWGNGGWHNGGWRNFWRNW
jgi:rSAM-associated Gly-rich repeat protein